MASRLDMTADRPIARALRICAAIWLATGVLSVALGFVSDHIVGRMEDGATFEEIAASLEIVSWSSTAVHVLGTSAIAIGAGAWAGATSSLRDRVLVHTGRLALVLSLVLQVGQIAAWRGQVDSADFEMLERVRLAGWCSWYLGASLVVAGTRGPLAIRIGYGVLAAIWVGLIAWSSTAEPPPELPRAATTLAWALLTVSAAAGLWLAAPHYADVEPAPRQHASDPARQRAADGLALLRAALLGRVVLAIASVVVLIALRSSPGAAGAMAWMLAAAQCAVAVAIWVALTRYSSLADDALERAAVTLVIICMALGAMLELYGAALTTELFGYVAKAESAMSMWEIPSLTELETLQAKAQWAARASSLIGLVAAVALAHSLRRTALWLEDLANARRASTLIGLTILGGGTTVVLMAVAQSGTLDGLGPLGAMMAFALVIAIAILVAWLRLFGELVAMLRGDPPDPAA